tara:strand:- start:466 stop:678 length:213 start_codon:yes stop_codon:yes gene_type:complete
MIDEDWLLLGMIHAFRSLSIVREQDGDINNVDFEHLIEIQKRNLSDPNLADAYHKFVVNVREKGSLEEMR